METPFVTILVPTTKDRLVFIDLVMKNIKSQTYPHNKLELIVIGDKDPKTKRTYEHMFPSLTGVKCRYIECNIDHNIGKKRNFSCTKASHYFIVNMDDDDIYNKVYIEYSMATIKEMDMDVVG